MTPDEIDRRFLYHAPSDERQELHQRIREKVIEFALLLNEALPGESREKSLAFTALEESQFWAHAHIARPAAGPGSWGGDGGRTRRGGWPT